MGPSSPSPSPDTRCSVDLRSPHHHPSLISLRPSFWKGCPHPPTSLPRVTQSAVSAFACFSSHLFAAQLLACPRTPPPPPPHRSHPSSPRAFAPSPGNKRSPSSSAKLDARQTPNPLLPSGLPLSDPWNHGSVKICRRGVRLMPGIRRLPSSGLGTTIAQDPYSPASVSVSSWTASVTARYTPTASLSFFLRPRHPSHSAEKPMRS